MERNTISILLIAITTFAISVRGNPWTRIIDIGNGYIVGEERVTHAFAKSLCDFGGKKLLSIETREEDELVLTLLNKAGVTDGVWTSGENNATAISLLDWRWGNGKLLFYSRWIPTHPYYDSKYCLALIRGLRDRSWHSAPCNDLYLPICE